MTTATEKPCTKCGETKPITEYHRSAKTRDGHWARCKVCVLAQQAEYTERIAAERVEPSPTDTKTCTGCRVEKPYADYHRHAGSKDGRQSKCKTCFAAYYRAYYEASREGILANKKAYYEANREKVDEYARDWRKRNRERYLARKKAYHAERWETDPEYREQYYTARTRRRRLLANAKQEPYTRESIFARDGWTCWLCDLPIDRNLRSPDPKSPSIDHVVPLSRGGDDTPANVRASHFGCNSARGARVEDEDLEVAA